VKKSHSRGGQVSQGKSFEMTQTTQGEITKGKKRNLLRGEDRPARGGTSPGSDAIECHVSNGTNAKKGRLKERRRTCAVVNYQPLFGTKPSGGVRVSETKKKASEAFAIGDGAWNPVLKFWWRAGRSGKGYSTYVS